MEETEQQHKKSTDYNTIFEQLVVQSSEEDEDAIKQLIGMLAYAEYKLKKYRWVKNKPDYTKEELNAFLSSFDKRELGKLWEDAVKSLEDFGQYYTELETEEKLNNYKEQVLSKFLKETESNINSKISNIEKEISETNKSISILEDNLHDKVDKSTTFKKSVWEGFLGSMSFSVFLLIVVVVIRSAAPESNFGKLIQFIVSPEEYQIELQKLENKPTESTES